MDRKMIDFCRHNLGKQKRRDKKRDKKREKHGEIKVLIARVFLPADLGLLVCYSKV